MRSKQAISLGLLLGVGACGGGPTLLAPAPLPAPAASVEPVAATTLGMRFVLPEPSVTAEPDPLRATPMLRDPEFLAEVDRWVERWTNQAAPWLSSDLERMGRYVVEIDSILGERRLPRSLRYLPIIESGYNPRAVSPARAVGLWQLMEGTARGLGIRVSPLLDERRHPLRSTEAALTFLDELHHEFGSWFLALAAYNSGPGRVRRLLDRYAPLEPRSDDVFWRIRPYLPRETRDFVPKLFAAIRIAERPDAFGHARPTIEPPRYDEVEVPDATTLDVVARAAGVALEDVERMNPHVVRGLTPPGVAVPLRLPEGSGETFMRQYPEIPPEERVSFVEHRVAVGETLSHIAVRYGIRVADLEAANPGVRARYLKVGSVLTIPVAPSARAARRVG